MHGKTHRVLGGQGDLTTVHAHATRILTGAQSGGSEGYGSGDKTEVLENFLKDSLSVAKRSVKGLSSSRGGPPRSLRALRERLPPVNEDKPSSAFRCARPKGPGKHETQVGIYYLLHYFLYTPTLRAFRLGTQGDCLHSAKRS
jgi:hypothetical protein